jgi:hypothetical protein
VSELQTSALELLDGMIAVGAGKPVATVPDDHEDDDAGGDLYDDDGEG